MTEQIVNYLDSIISRASDIRNATYKSTLYFPDGIESGLNEIKGLLEDADDSLDTIANYYL